MTVVYPVVLTWPAGDELRWDTYGDRQPSQHDLIHVLL